MPDVDEAPRLAIVAGMGLCITLLALVFLAVFAVMDEIHHVADQRANEPVNLSFSVTPGSPMPEKQPIERA